MVRSAKKLDTGRGSGITKDSFEWRSKIKVPPIQKKKELGIEEFEKLLKVQRAVKPPSMSKDEFVKTLKESEIYGMRRKYRSEKERKKGALEWFSIQEDNWWTNEQMKILIHLDQSNFDFKVKCYNTWKESFVKKCRKIYKQLMKEGKDKEANDFSEEAYQRLQAAKPRKRTEVEQTIVTRIRRLTMQRRYYELNKIMEELRPLLPPEVANGPAK